MPPMKCCELIADKLTAAGWAWGYYRAVTRNGWRWTVDVYRGDGPRYIVQSDATADRVSGIGSNITVIAGSTDDHMFVISWPSNT
jgi:hypothetical protein